MAVIAVTAAALGTSLHGFFANRALRTLGKYSYAMYLFHGLLREPFYRRLSSYLLNSPTEMTWSMRLVFMVLGSGVSFLLRSSVGGSRSGLPSSPDRLRGP